MAVAAFNAQVKISGTAVAMTGEATTSLGSSRYQITNTAKRIVDPSAAVTVNDGGTPVSASLWALDYLFGIVTFSAYTPSGAITIDGSYLPTTTIGDCRSVEFSGSVDLPDVSTFGTSAHLRAAALADCSGSLGRLALPLDDLDGVAVGTQSIHSWMTAGTPRLLDVLFTTGARLRAWIVFAGYKANAAVDGIVEVSCDFQGAPQGYAGAVFGWGS